MSEYVERDEKNKKFFAHNLVLENRKTDDASRNIIENNKATHVLCQ